MITHPDRNENLLCVFKVDGGHTGLLTYSDLCLASNALIDGGLAIVDDITHPGWLGVRDGTGRFLAETSSPMIDEELENELQRNVNRSSVELSKRIVQATRFRHRFGPKSNCSRLVPFLQCFNKLFLTTPNYYPDYIELLASHSDLTNATAGKDFPYLRFNSLRLTIGHVPIWTDNFDSNPTELTKMFKEFLEPKWMKQLETSNHHVRLARAA